MPPDVVPAQLVLKPGIEFFDEARQAEMRTVLREWLSMERLNLYFQRMGIARFRMPANYATNVAPSAARGEQGWYVSDASCLRRGILRLADAASCLGDRLQRLGDVRAAVRATALLDHLHQTYPAAFKDELSSQARISGTMLTDLVERLKTSADPPSAYAGLDDLDRVAAAIEAGPLR